MKNISEEEKLIFELQEICRKLNWSIALIDQHYIDGLIIGQNSYIKNIIDQLQEEEKFEVWSPPENSDGNLH